jgi:hypothetical protein
MTCCEISAGYVKALKKMYGVKKKLVVYLMRLDQRSCRVFCLFSVG